MHISTKNILSVEDLDVSERVDETTLLAMPAFYTNISRIETVDKLDPFEEKCLKKLTGRTTSKPKKQFHTMDIDCFIMFSPQYSAQSKQAISCYLAFYPLLEKDKQLAIEHPEDDELVQNYHDSEASLILLSVTNGYYLTPVKRKERWYASLPDVIDPDAPSRLIEPLNIMKIFKGSHVHKPESEEYFEDGIIFTGTP